MKRDGEDFERLIRVIEELASGNLDARYPISDQHHDVDAIGFGFNILADELSATIEDLTREVAERRAAEAHRREAERQRVEAREELESLRTARLASIGVLAAGVGHEINNPLSYVIGNISYSLRQLGTVEEPSGTSEIRGALREAREGAERIRRIVQDLRLFARVDEDEVREAIDVREVLEASLGLVNNEIRHRARLVRDYRATPSVFVSEPRLAQVLVNLLVNAAHSLPPASERPHEIRVVLRPAGAEEVSIEVADTGVGISEADLPRVFDPFFSTKPRGIGTGLGLSICRELVSKMGGRIEVESQVDVGTTFRVTLPATTQSEPQMLRAPSRERVARSGARVLVIDDDRPVARALERLLDAHEVTVAEGGRQALAVLASDRDFDVVFCDLMMPDTSGMEVFETVRSEAPALAERFVFVTGGAFTEEARRFVGAVPNECVQKPFELDQIERLIAERRAGRRG